MPELIQPSLRDSTFHDSQPSVETLGYSHLVPPGRHFVGGPNSLLNALTLPIKRPLLQRVEVADEDYAEDEEQAHQFLQDGLTRALSRQGLPENSPAFQRRVWMRRQPSPEGTAEEDLVSIISTVPSGRMPRLATTRR